MAQSTPYGNRPGREQTDFTQGERSMQEPRTGMYPGRQARDDLGDLDEGRFQTGSRSGAEPTAGRYARTRHAGPKNWQRTDERIQDDVCERLARAYDIDVSDVSVSVQQGTVTLTGTVDDRHGKHRVEDLADDCAGVRDVENRLRVREARTARGGSSSLAEFFGFTSGTKVADIMTRDVRTVGPDDMIQRAAQIMRDSDVGSVPVCDGMRLQGMITDRDIAIRAVATGRPTDQTHVSEAMTHEVFWCYEDEEIADVLDKMGDRQVRRIPVISRDHQLVGIVSLGDMATQRGGTQAEKALEEISEPAKMRH